jgi:hypothetical protein
LHLKEWEDHCREEIARIPADSRNRAGALLPCVPERAEWESLQQAVKESWRSFEDYLHLYPHTLLTLYAGLAFHEYEDNTFWPQFWRFVGVTPIQTKQNAINESFDRAASFVGLPIQVQTGHRSFVGSAVYFIGVPVSVWDDFLGICYWAVWHSNWGDLSDAEWVEVMSKRCGGRKRLLNFLTGNRKAASEFIGEMLGARRVLNEDRHFKLAELVRTSNLRREYFEEVPETADFLQRPEELDSLLADRPRLIWREDRVAVHLPPVSAEGASWRFEGEQQPAGDIATEFPVNGKAFRELLAVELNSDQAQQSFRISGLHPFGLFDTQRGRFANIGRTRLPADSYRLVSRTPLEIFAHGWAEPEKNECVQLEDGTEVFATSLWPASNRPTLRVNGGPKIEFGRRQRVNLRVFSGCENNHVLRFELKGDGRLLVERMPVLVLEIPVGFLPDEDGLLQHEFHVVVNEQPQVGRWRCYATYPSFDPRHPNIEPEVEYYEWLWADVFALGDYEIRVESPRVGVLPFGIRRSLHVSVVRGTDDSIWPTLHGDKFWIWILLSQIQDDPTWEEFWIARQAVAGFRNLHVNQNDWQKLEEHGFIKVRRKIDIQRSCLAIQSARGNTFVAYYAGLVNRLYSLVRAVAPVRRIEAKQERGFPPHLEIHWPASQRQFIRSICPREGIEVNEHSLWNL